MKILFVPKDILYKSASQYLTLNYNLLLHYREVVTK